MGFLRTSLFAIDGHSARIYSVLQYGGTVVLSVVAGCYLVRIGRARLFARPSDIASDPPSLGRVQLRIFWSIIAVGVVGGVAYALSRSGRHSVGAHYFTNSKSTVFIALCWVVFIGLVVACVALRSAAKRADAAQPVS